MASSPSGKAGACKALIAGSIPADASKCPSDEIGRHTGLKILGTFVRTGSIPVSGTFTMKTPLIDSHCHIDMVLEKLENPQLFASQLQQAQVKAVIHIASDDKAFVFFEHYRKKNMPFELFYTLGQHPGEVSQGDPYTRIKLAQEKKDDPQFVAVGEVGLDYYYGEQEKELQKQVFSAYIDLALQLKKPLAIHTRDAHEDTLLLLQKAFGKIPVVIHCFTGNSAQMQDYLSNGAYISFSGIVTFKNATSLQEAAKACPLERMLIETDAPFLSPVPKRGKTNSPAFLPYTFEFLAHLKNQKLEHFAQQLWQNTYTAFALPVYNSKTFQK